MVLFLGAGFLAPLGGHFGSWKALLCETVRVAHERRYVSEKDSNSWLELLQRPDLSSERFQRVAQVVEDALSVPIMEQLTAELLVLPAAVYCDAALAALRADGRCDKGIIRMRKRIALVRLLRVKAIVTTNFTMFSEQSRAHSLTEAAFKASRTLLRVDECTPRAISDVGPREIELLRCLTDGCVPPPWTAADPEVVHLHGTVWRDAGGVLHGDPVCTKQSYRSLLHLVPTFLPFVRTLLTTHPLLYLGFSFTDQYFEEVRSETLALLTPRQQATGASVAMVGAPVPDSPGLAPRLPSQLAAGEDPFGGSACDSALPDLPDPVGFAMRESASGEDEAATLHFFRRHEGLALLPYETDRHECCDEMLEKLVVESSLPYRLAKLLRGKLILCFDKARDGFAQYAETLSRLVLATAAPACKTSSDALAHAVAQRNEYLAAYKAAKEGARARSETFFLPPPRETEEWPLMDRGSLRIVFSRTAVLEQLREGGLPGDFPNGRACPSAAFEFETPDDSRENVSHDTCGLRDVRPSTGGQQWYQRPTEARRFAALITYNGHRDGKRSFLLNTLAAVRAMPQEQQMPVIVYGLQPMRDDIDRDALTMRRADLCALGCASFEYDLTGIVAALTRVLS